jgi:hypothetical protein
MDNVLARRVDSFSAWCGLGYVIALFIGWWAVAGFIPMHEPTAGAEEIAAIFRANHLKIRIGMIIVMWGSAAFLPFSSLIAHHIARFEAPRRTLTYTFIMAAFANAMFTFYPAMWWATAGFRATERSAELTYLLNDVGWLQFLGAVSLTQPMWAIIAIMALNDPSPRPVFPRWVGFFNLWLFVLLIPDQMLFFFYRGPFAWNGLIAVWIPLTIFTVWFFVMYAYLRKAIRNEYG